MEEEINTVFASFTSLVNEQANDIKDSINNMENKLLKSNVTRKRITEMYKNDWSNTDPTSVVPKNYNEIMLAINSQSDLLLPDMEENYDINISDTVQLIKEYAEDISKSYNDSPNKLVLDKHDPITKLDLNEYSEKLNILNDRILRFNLNNIDTSSNKRSVEVEDKFGKLSEEIQLFTKMVKAQSSLQEGDKKLNKHTDEQTYKFEVIDQLLSKTNEVTFTLSNKINK